MSNGEEKLKLTDLIDIDFLQELQDIFAKATGVASLTVDDNGPITKPSNFSEFCQNFIRANERGSVRCNESDVKCGEMAMKAGKPVICTCHAGLGHFAVPIIVNGYHIASILGGQFAFEKPIKKNFINLAQDLRISDKNEYIEALKKIKTYSKEHIQSVADLLFLVSNTISKIASKNLDLIKKNKKEKFYNDIIESIRSSLDIQETLLFICEETTKFFNVQRATISEAPKNKNKRTPFIRMEFKTVSDAEGVDKLVNSSKISKYYAELLEKGGILAVNNISESDIPDFLKESYDALGVKSLLAIPVQKNSDKWGVLVLSEYNNYRNWSDEEIELAKSIAGQIYIAIKHAELYEKEKDNVAKEVALRDTIKVIRSTLDTDKIKRHFLEVVYNYFGADRCIFDEYDKKKKEFLPFRVERLKRNDIKSLIGVSVEGDFPEFADKLKNKKRNIIIKDVEKTLARKKLPKYKALQTLYNSDVKSDYGFLVQYKDEILGILILHYVKNKRVFSSEELAFLKILQDQAGVALYQAELYEKSKNQIKRETLLRGITEKIRGSLDIQETLSFICEGTAKLFDVQRASISEFPNLESDKEHITRMEYKTIPTMAGLIDLKYLDNLTKFYIQYLIQHKEILAIDNISESDTPDYFKESYNILGVKSIMVIPIQKENEKWGVLILSEYNCYRRWLEDEIKLAQLVASQIYIAITQAELYEKEKEQTKREFILREITERIRSSLDIDETLGIIVNETANLFNVDRIAIIEFPDKNNLQNHIIRREYKVSEDIRSPYTIADYFENGAIIANHIITSQKPLIINNINESDFDEKSINFYKTLAVKSLAWIPIISKENELWGFITLSKIKEYKTWKEDDISFLISISNQIYIAINQAELFVKSINQGKKETLLREITERIRSSLDIEETLSFICEETAKLFNVQRSAITTFPTPNDYGVFIVRKEYKYWENMESFGFREGSAKTAAYWGNILIKGGAVLAIDNIEEANVPDYFKDTYRLMGVKALIGTAIRKENDVFGTLVLTEYNNQRHWSEDDKILLRTIADQVYIAINQAELFKNSQKKAQNERALRDIMLNSVQTFEVKKMIQTLVTEAGKLFESDRCFFIEVDNEANTNLPIQDYAEYRSSEDIVSHTTRIPSKEETSDFIIRTKEKKYEFSVNVSKEPIPEACKKMLIDDLGVKSYLITPVFYGEICYGAFVFHYVKNFKQFSQDEIDMAIAIASQSAVILHQAELFELTKTQAEREKISKNIIEILRSTLDKSIIKRLFVKSIGQFLKADRVLFSEFNAEAQTYMPVSSDSEYLSSPDFNSFVGYDWSCEEAREYIQPLLEKREFHIYNWSEYLPSNARSQNFINLFERRGAKSSYSFPVMYQQQLIGFFSIGFVKNVRRLSDEDINRVRSICTQAGIALYHAHLYEEAQKSVQKHDEFVHKLSNELNGPLNLIIDFSSMKSEHEVECVEEVEHLNKINANAQKLLYFMEDITKDMKKLNLE